MSIAGSYVVGIQKMGEWHIVCLRKFLIGQLGSVENQFRGERLRTGTGFRCVVVGDCDYMKDKSGMLRRRLGPNMNVLTGIFQN